MSALDDAIDMLACFSASATHMTQADLVRRTGVPKATASRVLKALRERGVLDHDPERRLYSVGVRLFELGQIYRQDHDFLVSLNTKLEEVCADTGMTGYITVFDGSDLVVLRMVQGQHPLAIFTPPGVRVPCWSTSNGRAMLAELSDAEVLARLPDPLPQVTPASPATRPALLDQLRRIRATGQSSSAHETLPGVGSEGIALRDPVSQEIFGIAISYPAAATTSETRRAISARLSRLRQEFPRAARAAG